MKRITPIVLAILLLAVVSLGCTEAAVLHVKVTIGGTEEKPVIQNVTIEKEMVNAIQRPKDQPNEFPGVYVFAVGSKGKYGDYINYWTSTAYHGPGTYELTSGLKKIPEDGERFNLIIRINDKQGKQLAGYSHVYTW